MRNVTREDLIRAMQPTIGTGPQNGPMDARDIARALGIADDNEAGAKNVAKAIEAAREDGAIVGHQDHGQRQIVTKDEDGNDVKTWVKELRWFYQIVI